MSLNPTQLVKEQAMPEKVLEVSKMLPTNPSVPSSDIRLTADMYD
jgi:hypothetical protein